VKSSAGAITAAAHPELSFGYPSEPRLRSVDRLSAFRWFYLSPHGKRSNDNDDVLGLVKVLLVIGTSDPAPTTGDGGDLGCVA
jgi:hypothetical protein